MWNGPAGGVSAAALVVAVSTVTAMGVVVPSAATLGTTLQVELAGAPVQLSATLPERPVGELSCTE